MTPPARATGADDREVGLDDPAALLQAVGAELAAFVADRRGELAGLGPGLDPFLDAATEFVEGGKRLRPRLAYWGWRAAGGPPDDHRVVAAAASLEWLQASALVHDDVMDGSDLRRGRPAAHRAFAALHDERGYVGDPRTFGDGAAILLGDLLLSWCDDMLDACTLPRDAVVRGNRVLQTCKAEVIGGQFLDLLAQAGGSVSVEESMRVVRYKAAKYTVERPLHLGAALAGGGGDLVADLTAYGLPLGEAFQLRDDVLGVFGDPALTGKPAGDDLREGKRTVLLARAHEAATPAQAALLDRHVGDPGLAAGTVEELRAVIVATGALAAVEEQIAALETAAARALEAAAVEEDARRGLADVLRQLSGRLA